MKNLLNHDNWDKCLQATKCVFKLMPGDRFHHDWIKARDGKDHAMFSGGSRKKVAHRDYWGKPMRAKDS